MPTTAAIVGSGNIGTDLMYKLMRSELIEPRWMVGIDPDSQGIALARDAGLRICTDGESWLEDDERPAIVFEATSAHIFRQNAPRYQARGMAIVDLTPAAIGPYVVPSVNLKEHIGLTNLNMVTCGGQATIPIVHAVSRVCEVPYAEIVATVASVSAGPGTRQNIDEFTRTTSAAVETIGGAQRGKAIIILNPADPPLIMRDTIFCQLPDSADEAAVSDSIRAMARDVQSYVPGYRLTSEPQFDHIDGRHRVAAFVEVEGAGDFLPPYAGNLDIMTAAAARVGEEIAIHLAGGTNDG